MIEVVAAVVSIAAGVIAIVVYMNGKNKSDTVEGTSTAAKSAKSAVQPTTSEKSVHTVADKDSQNSEHSPIPSAKTLSAPTPTRPPSKPIATKATVGFQIIWRGKGNEFIEVKAIPNGTVMDLTFKAHNFSQPNGAGRGYVLQGLDTATKQIIEQVKRDKSNRINDAIEDRSHRQDDFSGSTVVRSVVLRAR